MNCTVLLGIENLRLFSDHSARLYLIHLFLIPIKVVYISFWSILYIGNNLLYSNDFFVTHENPFQSNLNIRFYLEINTNILLENL